MEIIGPKWRAFAGQMNHIYYSLGCVCASILSFYFRDWAGFTYSVVVLHLPLLLFWFCVPGSPRWLYLKNRHSEGTKPGVEKLV